MPGIFTLRNLQDVDRIKAAVDGGVKHVVVVGAGFIGLELVENFVQRGIATTVVELQDQVLPPFDKEMTTPIYETLIARRVNVLLGQSADAFERADDGIVVRLKSGERLTAQLVVLGIGVRPENKLAVDAGLEVGPRGGIRVNEYLQTNDPNIYAVGDAIEVRDFISGDATQVPLAGPANRQGRIAADNIFGRSVKYRGTQGTAILGCFGVTAAMTGASEKSLRCANRPFRKVYIHPAHHAGYYPGARVDIEGSLSPRDGQAAGSTSRRRSGGRQTHRRARRGDSSGDDSLRFGGNGTRLCTAVWLGQRSDQYGRLCCGWFNARRTSAGRRRVLLPSNGRFYWTFARRKNFALGHLPAAVNIPIDELRSRRIHELPRDRAIAAYCQVGQRGYLATRILRQKGFNAVNVGGGYKTWRLFQPCERA